MKRQSDRKVKRECDVTYMYIKINRREIIIHLKGMLIAGRNISNIRYTDDFVLLAESDQL